MRTKALYAEHHSNTSQDTGGDPYTLRVTGHFATVLSEVRLWAWSLSEFL